MSALPPPSRSFSPTLPPFAPRLDCDAACDALSLAHSLRAPLVRAHEFSPASDASTLSAPCRRRSHAPYSHALPRVQYCCLYGSVCTWVTRSCHRSVATRSWSHVKLAFPHVVAVCALLPLRCLRTGRTLATPVSDHTLVATRITHA